MCLITVIVPVYNVAEYLPRCIDSIMKQTYAQLEIILVDDGATDNSGQICDQFALRDKRIKVIHKANGGLSDARNTGISVAKGEYIGFVDADDFIEYSMYEQLYSAIKTANAQIAVCGRWVENNGVAIEYQVDNKFEVMNNIQALQFYFLGEKIDPSACDKLFKKSLFEDVLFPKGKIHEDIFVMHHIIEKSTVVRIGVPLYHYVNRTDSITKSKFSEKNLEYIEAHKDAYQKYEQDIRLKPYVQIFFWKAHIVIIDKLIIFDEIRRFNHEFKSFINLIRSNIVSILLNDKFPLKNKVKSILIVFSLTIYKCNLLRRLNRN